jgi:hypothetical protein
MYRMGGRVLYESVIFDQFVELDGKRGFSSMLFS